MTIITKPINRIASTLTPKEVRIAAKIKQLDKTPKSNESLMQQRAKEYRDRLKKGS